MRTVFLKDAYVPEAEAKLSIYDLSIMQGAAAFEMTRSFNGEHFKLIEHLERLQKSCELLHIPMPYTIGQLADICARVTRRNDHGPGEEHRLLIVISPGCAPMYRSLEGVIAEPFAYVADFPLRYTVKGMGTYFTEGVHAVCSDIVQPRQDMLPMSAKHRSRLHFHLAQLSAPAGTWPLLCDVHGQVAEAPGANVVAFFGSAVVRNRYGGGGNGYCARSPFTLCSKNALPGISMATVAELLQDDFPPPYARTVNYGFLKYADEIWLTGTPFCMLPVTQLDGEPVGDGRPGKYFNLILERWSKRVGVDIKGQIIEWDRQ